MKPWINYRMLDFERCNDETRREIVHSDMEDYFNSNGKLPLFPSVLLRASGRMIYTRKAEVQYLQLAQEEMLP
jgi:hypothetical protein